MARDKNGSLIKKQNTTAGTLLVASQIKVMQQNLLSTEITAYPNNPEGLQMLKEKTIEYLAYIQAVNENEEIDREIIPDIEGWASYLGTNRVQINRYAKRGLEWRETIDNFKNGIASIKKQLALQGKIPSIMAIFDLTNNHGYVNSSEFKINNQTDGGQERTLTDEEIRAKYGNEMGEIAEIPD